MNLLIVDDQVDNREILTRLLKQYERKFGETFTLFEAQNGQEAVDICDENSIDILFMDIMMPIMDGLEATKQIKKKHASVLIIVLSSENDESFKSSILQAGAEDYIVKPFSSSVMFNRLHNYLELMRARHSIGYQVRAVNTFTKNIYSYQMTFFVTNKDDLAQFWETLLVRLKFQRHIPHLSDFVRFLFRLGRFQLQKSYKCHIYIEEDATNFYLSMDNMRLLPEKTVLKVAEKYCSSHQYRLVDDIFSFALFRDDLELVAQSQSLPVAHEEILQTYKILDDESLDDFEHIVQKLKTEISLMGSSSMQIDDIDLIKEYINKLATILGISNDAYEISKALQNLARLLEEYSEPFLAMSKDLSVMMNSFLNDLFMWKEMVFYTGAPSVDFLNHSISSSVQMIRAVFITDDTTEDGLDDIFDF